MTMPTHQQNSSSNNKPPIPLWIDADPSGFYHTGLDCDDDLAILAALTLHQRQLIQLVGLSICGGNAPLKHTWNDARTLWEYVNGYERTGIAPVKGYGWRSMQVGVKLLQWYNVVFPDVEDSDDAAIAMSERARALRDDARQQQQQQPLTILTLGPVTNVAKALQLQRHKAISSGTSSSIEGNIDIDIEHIYLMGGELTNQQLDLNFRSDRASARIVMEANVPKTIIPIQTCGQVSVTESWLGSLNCPTPTSSLQSGSSSSGDGGSNGNGGGDEGRRSPAVCAYMSKMRQQVKWMPTFVNKAVKERMTPPPQPQPKSSFNSKNILGNDDNWKASPNLDSGFIPWDIVALLSISHPEEFVDWKYHRVSIPSCEDEGGVEPCDGTMEVVEELGDDYFGDDGKTNSRNWSNVVRIPHRIRSETRLLEIMSDLIRDVEASSRHQEPPGMMWGFAPDFAGLGIAIIVVFLHFCHRIFIRRSKERSVRE